MKTYNFQVVVERDEDQWVAYCPALVEKGAATGGATREEAFENMQEATRMVLESLIELGVPIPDDAEEAALPSEERLAVGCDGIRLSRCECIPFLP